MMIRLAFGFSFGFFCFLYGHLVSIYRSTCSQLRKFDTQNKINKTKTKERTERTTKKSFERNEIVTLLYRLLQTCLECFDHSAEYIHVTMGEWFYFCLTLPHKSFVRLHA